MQVVQCLQRGVGTAIDARQGGDRLGHGRLGDQVLRRGGQGKGCREEERQSGNATGGAAHERPERRKR